MTKQQLPYWADQYLQHMQQFRPDTYAALQASGELESTALQIQEVASTFYKTQKAWYASKGYSTTEADIYADGDTKRQYICLPPDEADIDAEDFDDDDLDGELDDLLDFNDDLLDPP